MNTRISIAIIAVCLLVGCASPEQGAYRSIGTIATLVDGSMSGWGDYVRAGLASTQDEILVRGMYNEYQEAMSIAKGAVNAYISDPEGKKDNLDRALTVVESVAGKLTGMIARLTAPKQ